MPFGERRMMRLWFRSQIVPLQAGGSTGKPTRKRYDSSFWRIRRLFAVANELMTTELVVVVGVVMDVVVVWICGLMM